MVGYEIKIKMLDTSEKRCYDGKQIRPLWALEELDVSGNSIIIFRGSMRLEQEEMIDIKDINREKDLADILISGDDCIHFITEIFDEQPGNLKIAYHRLHILAFIVKDILENTLEIKLTKMRTDLYFEGKKINVAIATSSNNSSKIHFGINIVSTGVPDYVDAIGILDIRKNIDVEKLAMDIAEAFKDELDAINEDIVKSRTF